MTNECVFQGESREFGGNILYVDLIPETSWFSNARKHLAPADWDHVRHIVYERARFSCECCGVTPGSVETASQNVHTRRPLRGPFRLESHERFSYDEQTHVQKLERLMALCNLCHMTTHFGLARVMGWERPAFEHLLDVSGMSFEQGNRHVREAMKLAIERGRHQWTVDLSILTDSGILLKRKK